MVWNKEDRKPVGAPAPVFDNEQDAETFLARLSAEEIAAGKYEVVALPE
jgi:hypothetical protein